MAILKVLNVGNGDSMIITPPEECCFHDIKILIDLGPCKRGGSCLSQNISSTDNIHIFITHSHRDHFGGIKFFNNKTSQIHKITVPFYQNEIIYMAESILNLQGMRNTNHHRRIIELLEAMHHNQLMLKELSRRNSLLSFAYEGRRFSHHIRCFNPPIMMDSFDWLREASLEDLVRTMHEIFEHDFAENMSYYLRSGGQTPLNNDLTLEENDREDTPLEITDEIRRRKASYVVDFIIQNLRLFRNFNMNPNKKTTLKEIHDNLTKHVHDTCTVLHANYGGRSFLLTGDASKEVFERLISGNKDISAYYLKVPHHGSKENITQEILDQIAPTVAIISHNNHKRYDHPNQEILNLLSTKIIMLTNDVIKNNITCMKKINHLGDSFVEIS